MTTSILRSVRFSFVTLLLGLTVYTVGESAVGARRASAQASAEGLSTCGTEANPCALDAVAVVARVAPGPRVQFAASEGLTVCGSEEQPCVLAPLAVQAKREATRLASAERMPRMTMRRGS
jgi:hypothetical protein